MRGVMRWKKRGAQRSAEESRAHKRSSLTGNGLDLRLHAYYCLQDERNRERGNGREREGGERERERE